MGIFFGERIKNFIRYSKKRMDKKRVEYNYNKSDFYIMIIGQSNACNHGQNKYYAKNFSQLNFFYGKYYIANDPLLGASGNNGSIWINVGEKLSSQHENKIIWVPVVKGSAGIEEFTKGGNCFNQLNKTLFELNKKSIEINLTIIIQGEEDNYKNTDSLVYYQHMKELITNLRNHQMKCPIYVAQTTYHPLSKNRYCISPAIREAQKKITELNNVFLGIDYDKFNMNYHRYDGIHLSEIAQKEIAEEWVNLFKNLK